MKSLFAHVRIAAVSVSMLVLAAGAQAQATRTWVSGVGDDVNPCSRTAPCKTYAGAISKTAENGEISVLDPGGFGTLTITKGITVNGHNQVGSTLAALAPSGFTVNVTLNPTLATVYLHDLVINGATTGTDGIRYLAGANLIVENVRIWGFADDGIDISGAGTLNFKMNNVTIEDVGGDCLTASTSAGQVVAMVDDSKFRNCAAAGITAVNRVRLGVTNSVISHAPVGVRTTGTDSIINLAKSFVSFCTTGIQTTTGAIPGRIRVSDTEIAQNATGIDFSTGGFVDSFQGNSLMGNPGGNAFSSTTLKQ